MRRLSRPQLLLVIALVSVALTLGMVTIYRRQQESLNRLRASAVRFEEEMRVALQKNRAHYEAIIRAVEKQDLNIGEPRRFAFPKTKTPDDLQRVEKSFEQAEYERFCEENTLIFAWRPADGTLRAAIVIRDKGDEGHYQLFYTGRVFSAKEMEEALRRPSFFAQIDPHWWSIVDCE